MIDSKLVSLLQCPATGQELVLDDDPASLRDINDKIAGGRLATSAGRSPETPVEAVLRSTDRSMCYPISGGMLSLLPESVLVDSHGRTPVAAQSQSESEIQRKQMQQYSEVYGRWTGGEGGITRALQRVLHERYRDVFNGASVLDVGNGGTPPETQLGVELAQLVDRFIAVDKSPDMLRRSGNFGDLVLGDAFKLPFKPDSVDVVMVNNTIHHFGLRRGEDSAHKLQAFFAEALRVAKRGVIGVELLVPSLGESVERFLLHAAGFMPTFVYSASFYRRTLPTVGGQVDDFQVRKLRELTSPWKIIPPVLDFTWLRVPTFLVPYSFLFFSIEK